MVLDENTDEIVTLEEFALRTRLRALKDFSKNEAAGHSVDKVKPSKDNGCGTTGLKRKSEVEREEENGVEKRARL
jgi:hypothetical protein